MRGWPEGFDGEMQFSKLKRHKYVTTKVFLNEQVYLQ